MAELKALPKNNPLVRVLVADSNRMNTQLLVEALARDLALQVTEAEPAEAAILTAGEQADVLLLSSTLGESPKLGFQIAKRLTDEQSKTRVVMLLDTSDRLSVLEAFRAGVRGVFCRT